MNHFTQVRWLHRSGMISHSPCGLTMAPTLSVPACTSLHTQTHPNQEHALSCVVQLGRQGPADNCCSWYEYLFSRACLFDDDNKQTNNNGPNFVNQNGERMFQYPWPPLLTTADMIHNKAPVLASVRRHHGPQRSVQAPALAQSLGGREVHNFQIDVELVGANTIVLSRWEGRTYNPLSTQSFRITFETTMSHATPGCLISGHYWAITYVRCDVYAHRRLLDAFTIIGEDRICWI
jgi:hypothetical protein